VKLQQRAACSVCDSSCADMRGEGRQWQIVSLF
jgi:hypothetical protein